MNSKGSEFKSLPFLLLNGAWETVSCLYLARQKIMQRKHKIDAKLDKPSVFSKAKGLSIRDRPFGVDFHKAGIAIR